MGAEQILTVAVLALVVAAILITIALFTRKNVEGVIKLPGGFEIQIKGTDLPNAWSDVLAVVKTVIWQHNTDFGAVVNGADGAILVRTTTHTEYPSICQRIGNVRNMRTRTRTEGTEYLPYEKREWSLVS